MIKYSSAERTRNFILCMEASKDTYKSNVKLLFKYLAKGGGEIVYNGLNIEISNSIAVMIRCDNVMHKIDVNFGVLIIAYIDILRYLSYQVQSQVNISSKSGFLSSRDVNLIIGFLMKKYVFFLAFLHSQNMIFEGFTSIPAASTANDRNRSK